MKGGGAHPSLFTALSFLLLLVDSESFPFAGRTGFGFLHNNRASKIIEELDLSNYIIIKFGPNISIGLRIRIYR